MVTKEILARYVELSKTKKAAEEELESLKKMFNLHFDQYVGQNEKGELTVSTFKLQRQIRKTEKYEQESTVKRLEELNLHELIQKKPDEGKIKSALDLGLLKEADLEGCRTVKSNAAIIVKDIGS
jgi:hypothetical protein